MKSLLLISFTILCSYSYSQEPRVITFESEQEASDTLLEKNVFKVSLFELISGDFPIYYERVLSNKFSVEASIGITFGDYIGGLTSDIGVNPLENDLDSKYGFSLSAAIRFYPIEVLEDFYIAPEFKFRKYKWDRDIETSNDNPPFKTTTRTFSESRKYAIPRITIGYAFFYDNQLSFDYHLGIGMNTPTESIYRMDEDRVTTEKLNTRPRFHIGFKIGYVF